MWKALHAVYYYNLSLEVGVSIWVQHLTRILLLLLLLLLEALQLQRSFGLLNESLPFGPVSDAVLPIWYYHPCYIALYIILPSIFWSS